MHRLILCLCAVGILAACTSASPPVQEMSDARLAIAAAEQVDAAKHAPTQFVEAKLLLKSAQSNLERRAYAAARRDAGLAKQLATEAREASERRRTEPNREQPVPIK
ncbi:MAG: DUF4398 domain-containing protein [Pseudomonadota bacterium]